MEDCWSDWTPCEMYGHEFNEYSSTCECGEQRGEYEV